MFFIDFILRFFSINDTKSNNSIKTLQLFSIENGLGTRDGLPTASKFNTNKSLLENKQSKDFSSDEQISLSLLNNTDKSNYQESTNRYQPHFNRLEELESELIEKSALLKDNSQIIISLKERKLLTNLKKK